MSSPVKFLGWTRAHFIYYVTQSQQRLGRTFSNWRYGWFQKGGSHNAPIMQMKFLEDPYLVRWRLPSWYEFWLELDSLIFTCHLWCGAQSSLPLVPWSHWMGLRIFWLPLNNWIKKRNSDVLDRVAEAFGEATGGIFRLCIGGLDGVAIKIKSPTISSLIPGTGNYFCCKGFYALNVQTFWNKYKRALGKHWTQGFHTRLYCFGETKFLKILEDLSEWFEEKGYFLIGNSAYTCSAWGFSGSINSDAQPNSAEDAFNFWLSNSRIQIECTFGEIVMRWGIFWRKLLFGIERVGSIMNAALILHNLLVDDWEADVVLNAEVAVFFRNFSLQTEDARLLLAMNILMLLPQIIMSPILEVVQPTIWLQLRKRARGSGRTLLPCCMAVGRVVPCLETCDTTPKARSILILSKTFSSCQHPPPSSSLSPWRVPCSFPSFS